MSQSVSAATPMSPAAIALRLLRGAAAESAGNTPAARTAPAGETADRAAYEEGLDRLFRDDQRRLYDYAVEKFRMTYETSAKLALALESKGEAMAAAVPQALHAFAPEDASRLAALGADAAIPVPEVELDQAAFDDLVGNFVHDAYADLPGFAKAMAAGTVTIQRGSDVPEFNFGHKSFTLFKDGDMIGGAGWGKPFNQKLYDQIAATGIEQAFGSVMGQNFYVTWPGGAARAAG